MKTQYDDEAFFSAYGGMERSQGGLEASGEWSTLKPLIPSVEGRHVLDLGCGYGWHSAFFAQKGAASVTAVDSSGRMLAVAREKFPDRNIDFIQEDILGYRYPENCFDLVFSNLALHYIEDLDKVYALIHRTLKRQGQLLFTIEHPVYTAGIRQEFKKDEDGLFWPVQGYFRPSVRDTNFLGCSVRKVHHTLSQILEPLIALSFHLDAVREVMPDEAFLEAHPELESELERPMMLIVKATKENLLEKGL